MVRSETADDWLDLIGRNIICISKCGLETLSRVLRARSDGADKALESHDCSNPYSVQKQLSTSSILISCYPVASLINGDVRSLAALPAPVEPLPTPVFSTPR